MSYEGQYCEGKKQGIGKLQLPNGDKYHGSFVADKFEGEGSYFFSNGDVYSGTWRGGERNGEGTFMYARDESQLVGTWSKGSMITGKWIWKDGTSWTGPFKNSQPLGKGVFYFPNGLVQDGEFVMQGDDTEMKTSWKGNAPKTANASAREVIKAQ